MTTSSNKKPNLKVDHTYTDYAIISKQVDVRLLEEESPELPAPSSEKEAEVRRKLKEMSCTYGPMRKNAGGVTQPFPGKLMEVLNRTDLAEIIEWMPHGRAFLVKQPKTFASQVLPRYFKQSKYLSFTRQLNLWGFKRITRGKDIGAYYHEIFLRGRPHLAMRMKRQKIKGTGMKLTPNPDSEPDFYTEYPMMPQLEPSLQNQGPLPPLPAERMGMLMQPASAADVSGQNLLKALKVASSQQQPNMQPPVLTHPQLHHMQQQHHLAAASRMMPGATSDYHRLFGAMNASAGVNSMFSAETLHQLQQQQQQQLQQAVNGTNGQGPANNGGYQHLYGAMNPQTGINPMLAAASQLPSMIPSAMLQSGMLPSAHFTSHMAKRAYDDVLLAPGVRKQLGFNVAGLQNTNASTGTLGGGFSGSYGVKDQLSSVMLQYNNGGANPGQNKTTAPPTTPADLLQTAPSESSQSKANDDDADAVTTIAEGDAAAASAVAPPAATAGAATKTPKPDSHFTSHMAKRAYDDVLLAPGVRKQLGFNVAGLQNTNASTGTLGGGFSGSYGVKDQLSSVMLQYNNGGANPGQNKTTAPPTTPADLLQTAPSESSQSKANDDDADAVTTIAEGDAAAASAVAPPAATAGAATKTPKSDSPPPEKDASFAGYGNDPLQDALQKVHKLDDDAASLQRAKAKILQSMSHTGVGPTDVEDEEKKNGGDSSAPKENRPSLGRPFAPINSDD
ncbi:hypothetical protein ACHAWT_003700 [Skeletonema menzelii]